APEQTARRLAGSGVLQRRHTYVRCKLAGARPDQAALSKVGPRIRNFPRACCTDEHRCGARRGSSAQDLLVLMLIGSHEPRLSKISYNLLRLAARRIERGEILGKDMKDDFPSIQRFYRSHQHVECVIKDCE